MNKLPISVCMVSGAEAHRISKTLESVADWVTEIVVVLNEEVQDGTEEIAKRFGTRVIREPWKGFIGQKNSVAGQSSQEWLLNIDADEVVSPELRREIIELFSHGEPPCAAYSFPRCAFFCGRWIRHGDWYPDRVIRLWRGNTAVWVGQEPHARLDVNGRIGKLRSDLWHYSNDSIAQHAGKIVPYQVDFVKQRVAAGKSAGFARLVLRPWWRFFRGYVIRRGFLDGWPGYYIARAESFSGLTRYAMVKEAELKKQHG